MCVGLHVKFMLLLSPFNENCNILTNCSKNSNMKFHDNSSYWSCIFPCGLKDGQIERLAVISCFVNAPRMINLETIIRLQYILFYRYGLSILQMNLKANDWYSIILHSSSLASKLLTTAPLSNLYLHVPSTSFPRCSWIYFKRFTYNWKFIFETFKTLILNVHNDLIFKIIILYSFNQFMMTLFTKGGK